MYDAVEGTESYARVEKKREKKSLNSGCCQPKTNKYTFHAADMTAWVGKT